MEKESKFVYVLNNDGVTIGVFSSCIEATTQAETLLQLDEKSDFYNKSNWKFTMYKCAVDLGYVEQLTFF